MFTAHFLLAIYHPSRFPSSVLLESAIERLYDLRVGTTPVEEGTPHQKSRRSGAILGAE